MNRIIISLILSFVIFACQTNDPQSSNTDTSKEKSFPNIVLLVGDDQGYPYFGFMGADYVQTPNMDQLAASGTVFTQGYVPDNHCRPSLQTLLTGKLPIDYNKAVNQRMENELAKSHFIEEEDKKRFTQEFQFHAMQHFTTLPKIIANSGFTSFQGGKWWEFTYKNGGFTKGMTTGWTAEDRKQGGKWFKKFMGGDGLQLARATMQPVYDFIDKTEGQPFFIWYAPELPHYPFDAPEKYYNIYKDKDMTESAKRYYANCTWFDDGVGALMDYLKEKELFDNTLFVYVNDNGWEQAPHQEFRHDSLRWHNGGDKGKLSLYDQSYRTPIIFSWKNKIQAGVKKADLIESADIPATILDYLGMKIPNDYHGISYKNVIEGNKTNPRAIIIGNSNKMRAEEDMMGKDIEGYWLRNKDWFFRWIKSEDETALYDMNTDPNNDENVADAHPEIVKDFIAKIEAWKKARE